MEMPERRPCAAISAQTGKPCKRSAADGQLVCRTHMGISKAQNDALKRGQKRRKKALKKGGPGQRERWGMLLSGTLTVRDLDDEELKRMRVRGKGGEFNGRAPAVPSHLIAAFEAERKRRWKIDLDNLVPSAIRALHGIVENDGHKDQSGSAKWTIERALGKTPDVVQLQTSRFDEVAGGLIDVDRGVADDAEDYLASKGDEE